MHRSVTVPLRPKGRKRRGQPPGAHHRSKVRVTAGVFGIVPHLVQHGISPAESEAVQGRLTLLPAARRETDVAAALGLPGVVHQEDGSRDQVERFFQVGAPFGRF